MANQILGYPPRIMNSFINFKGDNNILYCGQQVTLEDCTLNFNGNNSVCFLGSSIFPYKLVVDIYNDSVFHMGENCSTFGKLVVPISEQKHCFLGDDCMVSRGVCIRNSDPHLIYDCKTKSRINPTKSVFIGDHVWLGQNSLILKGCKIDSGSIIAGAAVVASKIIPANSIWGGNPSKQLRKDVFWDRSCVHNWKSEITESSLNYDDYVIHQNYVDMDSDAYIFNYSEKDTLSFDEMDQELCKCSTSKNRLDYLLQLNQKRNKNRFVHALTED